MRTESEIRGRISEIEQDQKRIDGLDNFTAKAILSSGKLQLEWVLSNAKTLNKDEIWTCHTCKQGGFTVIRLDEHNNTVHANESHSASAPKEKCETVCHGGVDLKCKDCGAEYETNGFLTLKEKDVSREEKPKPPLPSAHIDFEQQSADGRGFCKKCGAVIRLDAEKKWYHADYPTTVYRGDCSDEELVEEPVFTLDEMADLMEKIEQSREFVKWLGTIEDEGVGAFWLVLRIIRERPDLVEKIRKEDLK